jgi:hypothetical protein
MLDGMRDQIIALACVRAGLPPHEGRGVDRLPQRFLDTLASTRARETDIEELRRGLIAMTAMFLDQVTTDDADLAAKLRDPIRSLTSSR